MIELIIIPLLLAEVFVYRYARRKLHMPRPWYWWIPGAGFVLLHRAMSEEDRRWR